MKIKLQFLITVQSIILWGPNKGQNIISGNFNNTGTDYGNRNADIVHPLEINNELSAIENDIYCVVRNGRIYVNGKYKRIMEPNDYSNLYQYKQGVARWSASLTDHIQLSFPWDPRNPQHNEFPWNPAAFPGKRRRRAVIPFPPLPSFCYE
ncbi:Pepsin inhibitor-3-like repeated domain family protein [Acanthocheilonema viteae]